MSALAKLPALLERISTLESGQTLCRRQGCYAEVFTWLSPYCRTSCAPRGGEDSFILRELRERAAARVASLGWDSEATFLLNRYTLMADIRLSMTLAAQSRGLSPFIRVSSAC